MRTVRLDDVVDPADVRVRDLPPVTHFVVQPREQNGIAREPRGEKLECDGLPQLSVVRAIDLSHPSGPEQARDPVASRDHGPRRELRLLNAIAVLDRRIRTDVNSGLGISGRSGHRDAGDCSKRQFAVALERKAKV